MKTRPDYQDAYNHMRKTRETFYQGMYPEAQVNALLDREEEVVIAESIRSGRNVAEHVYGLATQMGYVPKPAQQGAGTEEQQAWKDRQATVDAFRKDNEFPDVARLEQAKTDSKVGDGTYNRGGNARTMKGEQVFEQLPKAKRMQLFADPDKFRQFVLTGSLEI